MSKFSDWLVQQVHLPQRKVPRMRFGTGMIMRGLFPFGNVPHDIGAIKAIHMTVAEAVSGMFGPWEKI